MKMIATTKNITLTNGIGKLTMNQRIFYEYNGYLVIPKLISMDILEKCNERLDDFASGRVKCDGTTVMRDVSNKKSVIKIQDIIHDHIFREYFKNKEVLDIVEEFTGPNIIAVHSMLIVKPPNIESNSSRHPSHQDLYYFPFRPADRIVGVWTAMETCNKLNGCLFVSPGSHIPRKLYEHKYTTTSRVNNTFYHGIHNLPQSMIWINLEMEPGDTVFFHPHLIHGSGVNESTHTRKAISGHYAAADCHYIDVTNTIQEPLGKEVVEVITKKYPDLEMQYHDLWRAKSSLVRGVRSSL